MIRRQHKLDSPEVVILTGRAGRVVRQAESLARAGRMEQDAVVELRHLAGHSRYALSDALKNFKRDDLHLEWRHYNRSVRLLEAAITKSAVAPEDSRLTERLNQLQRLAGLTPDAAFSELAQLEPQLDAVRRDVASLPVRRWPQSIEELREHSLIQLQICERLRPLLGRQRADAHPILASETAFGSAAAHLGRIVCPEGPPKSARRDR